MRFAFPTERKLIKVPAAWFPSHVTVDIFLTVVFKGKTISDRFGTGLNTEIQVSIANRKALAVNSAQSDPIKFWIDFRQLRDIVGNFAATILFGYFVDITDLGTKVEEVRD